MRAIVNLSCGAVALFVSFGFRLAAAAGPAQPLSLARAHDAEEMYPALAKTVSEAAAQMEARPAVDPMLVHLPFPSRRTR